MIRIALTTSFLLSALLSIADEKNELEGGVNLSSPDRLIIVVPDPIDDEIVSEPKSETSSNMPIKVPEVTFESLRKNDKKEPKKAVFKSQDYPKQGVIHSVKENETIDQIVSQYDTKKKWVCTANALKKDVDLRTSTRLFIPLNNQGEPDKRVND